MILRQEKQLTIGHGDDLSYIRQSGATHERLLQKALPIGEFDKRLGMQFARNRPEP